MKKVLKILLIAFLITATLPSSAVADSSRLAADSSPTAEAH